MYQRIRQYIQSHNLIVPGDIVCAGLSGGPDSVCLFFLLLQLKEELGFELRAFHVNHQLRGNESEEDERFVRSLCNDYDVRLYTFEHDVAAAAEQMNCGTEEAGRILRISDAKECLQDGCTKIALGHHKNDQAETLLFNLARGCTLTGLSGIRPAAGPFIHPLLCFTRKEIIEFLDEQDLPRRTDLSNEDTRYTRNYIRHRILPEFTEGVNSRTIEHLAATADDMAHVAEIIDRISQTAWAKHTEGKDGQILIRKSLAEEDAFIALDVIARCIRSLSGQMQDISRKQLELTAELFRSRTGSTVSLPFELEASAVYGDILISRKKDRQSLETAFIPSEKMVVGGLTITSEFIEDPANYIREKNKYTKCFDYDKIGDSCVIRTRRPGDLITVYPDGSTKKLKDHFIDIKMRRELRDSVLLLASGNMVHWVIGYRMGDSAKITDTTTRCIKISVEGTAGHEY